MDEDKETLDIVKSIAGIASAVHQGSEYGANVVIDSLMDDPSYGHVAEVIGTLLGIESAALIAIGEGLLFLRYAKQFDIAAKFSLDEGQVVKREDGLYFLTEWPDELFQFVRTKYGLSLTKQQPIIWEEFTKWTAIKYERFWLLVNFDGVIVWHKNSQKEFDEDHFRYNYVGKLSGTLGQLANNGGLWRYYVVALTYPRSFLEEFPDIPHTALFEARNVVASDPEKVPKHLSGEERAVAIREPAQELVREQYSKGKTRVDDFRSIQKSNTQKRRGFEWWVPPHTQVWVIDPESGDRKLAIDFLDDEVARFICAQIGLANDDVDYIPLVWDGKYAYVVGDEGSPVAEFSHLASPHVEKAIMFLANKIRMKTKDASNSHTSQE